MAVLHTKFNLGDQVFLVAYDQETVRLPCRLCRGRGSLAASGSGPRPERRVGCPDCGGTATVALGCWPQWRVESSPLQIGQIQVVVYDRSGMDNGERAENRNPGRALRLEDEERYMAWSTGVGSGAVHRAADLFESREEAEEEAEDRTARSRAGEPVGDRRQWWPTMEQARAAAGFLDHRDVYEHDAGHVALAEAIVAAAASRDWS